MINISTFFWLTLLGLVPSLVWLGFYLRKDVRPEPRYLIMRVFFMGIIIAPLAIAGEWIVSRIAGSISPGFPFTDSPSFFLIAALIEETVKFLAIRYAILNDPEFDEPVDAMIYMIVAALGFAAIENILVLIKSFDQGVYATLEIWGLRFAGATLLHALSSAIVGYFLAMSWFYRHHSKKLITLGIGIATLFHATFNIIILLSAKKLSGLTYLLALLLVMSALISILFAKLKKRQEKTRAITGSNLKSI